MPKFVDYECEKCGHIYEDLFGDTEQVPDTIEEVCSECGGKYKKGLNLKSNCQVWKWRDGGLR
jgi:predicted nucleic acid-binding Zn ribbon protein